MILLFFFKILLLKSQASSCGDGVADMESGEECDDGNGDATDDCIGK